MPTNTIKIKAQLEGGVTTVRALITHEMETGLRKDAKTGQLIPAHFIQEVRAEHNGKAVLDAQWGPAVSKNPYLSFQLRGAKPGDTLRLSWTDNKGESDTVEATIG
jgi:sulfur-oxidizing protein SoxZ